LLLDVEDLRTITRMRPSEWKLPPVAVFASVKELGGTLEFDSSRRGTTLRATLPLVQN